MPTGASSPSRLLSRTLDATTGEPAAILHHLLDLHEDGVNALRSEGRSVLVITHYQRLLNYIVPDFVHVLVDGRIMRTGDKELALELESKGYDWVSKGEPAPA